MPARGESGPGPLVRAVYALVLRTFPSAFRVRFGGEMRAFFEAEWRARSPGGKAALLFRSVVVTGIEGIAERIRGRGRGEGMRDIMIGALRTGRSLMRRPGFTGITLLTLGLGVGAAATVFTIVDHVVLRPLPFPEPERLVSMWTTFENTGDTPFGVSVAVQYDYAEDARAIDAIAGYGETQATLTGDGEAARTSVIWLRGKVFEVTGIKAQIGRLPTLEDQETGAAAVAVVTDGFWRGALASDPAVIGRQLILDDQPVEIIGVLQKDAWLPAAEGGIWRPQAISRADIRDRSGHWMETLARLAPGATLETARAEMLRIQSDWTERFAGQHSPGHPGHALEMGSAHEWYFGDFRATGRLLLGAVGLLLVLACANVAALLLARGEARAGEFAVRRALGASRGRIATSLLAESGLIAVAGGGIGIVLAGFGTRAVLAMAPADLPRQAAIAVDGRVVAIMLGVSVLSGLVFGLMPALRGGGVRARTRGEAGVSRGLSRSLAGLVTLQLALAVTLLSGAGLLTRSVRSLLTADAGVETERRLTARISIPGTTYADGAAVNAFWDQLLTQVRALPGVASAALIRNLPLSDGLRNEGMVLADGTPDQDALPIADQMVGLDYFRTAGVEVIAGRDFVRADGPDSENVGIINQEAARRFFPAGDAIGAIVQPLWLPGDHGPIRIVGIVADVRHDGIRAELTPELYLPFAQAAWNEVRYIRSSALVVETTGEPAAIAPELRSIVSRMDPGVPVEAMATWDDVARSAVVTERFIATLVLIFSGLALGLAALGTYGLVSYTTAQRTREVGVRMALGAEPGRVARDVVGRTARLGIVGIGLGLLITAAAAPLLQSFLFGVPPRDPLTLLAAPLVLGLVTLLSAAIPALRASTVDPTAALRSEG